MVILYRPVSVDFRKDDKMRTLIQPLFVLVLFVLVRAGDLAITYALARSLIRAVAYGIVAVLALLAVLLSLFAL
jgi:hypothetical protein